MTYNVYKIRKAGIPRMNYENGTVRDLRIAYIGGGSRGWAWGLMTDLAKEPALSGTVSLYDINKEASGTMRQQIL